MDVNQPSDRSASGLVAAHTRDAIRTRLEAGPSHGDIRDFIFGAIDGTGTTFAVVSGVSGAGLPFGVLIVLGVANLVADGFSMGIGNFLGSRADQQQRAHTRREEEYHIRTVPEGEREEIRRIFASKGFSGAGLLPLLPFIYQAIVPGGLPQAFFWSMGLAGAVFFTIGALKGLFVEQRWYWAGLEILAIGGVAAGLAYLVGAVLKGVADMV